MVKAKDFLYHLCEDLDYRFFSGIPCATTAPLFKHMSADILHYIPAVHDQAAATMVAGTWLSGFKSCAILNVEAINGINWYLIKEVPILFIVAIGEKYNFKNRFITATLSDSFSKVCTSLDTRINTKGAPGLLLVKEGVFV